MNDVGKCKYLHFYMAPVKLDDIGISPVQELDQGYASSIIPTVLPPLTISECIASDEANSILQLSNMEGNSVALVTAISEGRGLVVADGSYMAERSTKLGTAAWKLEDELTKVNCKGMVRTTGKEKDVNPYQSKLQGLHATVSCISVICQHHQVISGKVTVCCNNEKALWLSSIRTIQVPLCTKHADLMRVIHKTNMGSMMISTNLPSLMSKWTLKPNDTFR